MRDELFTEELKKQFEFDERVAGFLMICSLARFPIMR